MEKMFQNSLFGYSKKSVFNYIAAMEAEFSQKLREKEQECQSTVRELEERLEELKQENERLQSERREVAGALIDAKTFAAQLMEQAEAESRARRAKDEAYHQAELQRLQALAEDVGELRAAIQASARDMETQMEQYEIRCQALRAEFEREFPEEPAAAESGERDDEPQG